MCMTFSVDGNTWLDYVNVMKETWQDRECLHYTLFSVDGNTWLDYVNVMKETWQDRECLHYTLFLPII